MRSLRICVLMIPVLALLIFAYWGDSAAAADSSLTNGLALLQAQRKRIRSRQRRSRLLPARRSIRKPALCVTGKPGTRTAPLSSS